MVVDTNTNTVVEEVAVGRFPYKVAVTPDGRHVYVTNTSNSVSVIDTRINTVVDTVAVGSLPYGVAITPDGKHVYVSNSGSDSISVIDTTITPNTVEDTVAVGHYPVGLAITTKPTSKDQCKKGGWKLFGFKNQGHASSSLIPEGK